MTLEPNVLLGFLENRVKEQEAEINALQAENAVLRSKIQFYEKSGPKLLSEAFELFQGRSPAVLTDHLVDNVIHRSQMPPEDQL
jgi:hypothetical protein